MADISTKFLEIRIELDKSLEKLTDLDLKLKKCSNSLRELKKLQKEETERATSSKEKVEIEKKYLTEINHVLECEKALKNERKQMSNVIQNEIKNRTQLNGSLNQMRATLKNLIAEYDKMSKKERQSIKGNDLANRIKNLTKEIKEAEMATGRFGRNVGNYMSAFKGLWKTIGVQMIGGFLGTAQAFVSIGNALKSGVETAIQFNRSVSKMQSILGGAAGAMDLLVAKAKELGSTTRYTATEVVQLQTELAKLGYTKNDILKMTEGVLFFAQATGSSLPDAAALAGASLRMFGKDVDSTNKFVDQMALATTKSALTFDYIKTALPIVGATAKTFGFELNEVLALVGQLANNGLEASMAATATRNILLNLANANGVLAKQLGKPVKNIHDLVEGLKELKERGVDLNDTLQLTDKRSVNAFNALLRGADSVEKLSKEIAKANGNAKKMADVMEDNLGGEITRLSSVWEDFTLSLNGSQGTLRNTIKYLSKIVKGLADIVRSVDESMNIATNKSKEFFESSKSYYYNQKLMQDSSAFQLAKNAALENGKDIKDAIKEAYDEVNKTIDKEEESLFKQYTESKKALDEYEKNVSENTRWMGIDFSKENNERIKRYLEDHKKDAKLSEKEYDTLTWAEEVRMHDYEVAKQIYEMRMKTIELEGKYLSQESRRKRLEKWSNQEENPTGIPVEDPSAKKKRTQLEKRIAKARLDAEKALEDDLLKLARDGADKRRYAIAKKYDQEIATVKYKLNEELRVLEEEARETPNLSQKAWDDLAAAKGAYEEMIKERIGVIERLKAKELKILDSKETERDLKEAIDLLKMYFNSVDSETEEYFDTQSQLLKLEQAKELEVLNQRFINEEVLTEEQRAKLQKMRENDVAETKVMDEMEIMLEEEKTKRIVAINKDYLKRLQKLDMDRIKMRNEKEKKSLQSTSLEHKYDGGATSARYSLQQAKLEYSQIKQDVGESPENFELRRRQAYDSVLQARMQLTNAIITEDLKEAEVAQLKARTELDALKATLAYKKKYLEEVLLFGKQEAETYEEYEIRKQKASLESFKAQRAYSDAMFTMWTSSATSIGEAFGTVSQAIQDCSEENEKNVRRAKILGLAEIYINQAVAIAAAIKDAAQSSISVYDMMAQIAIGITTVVSSTAQAISTMKQAKFAKGGVDIQGQGTSTSDSISARLSRGESVMTARATKMWKPILLAMNEIASKPNVTLPTQYSSYNPVQTNANSEQIGDAFKGAMTEIKPVVSVKEINEVSNRLQRVAALDNI